MDTTIIEVVLGLVLIYITLALLVMKVQETIIGRWGRGRAKNLHELMREAVGRDENLKNRIFANPLIFALSRGDETPNERKGKPMPVVGPSEVPPDLFARALLIELNEDSKGGHPADRYASPATFVAEKASDIGSLSRVWGTLRGLLAGREADWPAFESSISNWFADIGDRSEGWYRRSSQAWSLRLSIVAALLLNVDSFHVAEQLSSEPDLRRGFANLAERVNVMFPGGVPAPSGAPSSAPVAISRSERPEGRVVSRLVDAITRINDAFFRDKSIAAYRPDQRAFNYPVDKEIGQRRTKVNKDFCEGVEGNVDPVKDRAYLSNPASWVIILPQLLHFIERQEVLDATDASSKEKNLRSAYRCLSDVSVWVRSATSASADASVRNAVQEAAVALESAKGALLEMIENQRPSYSMQALFKAEPKVFLECAGSTGVSRASLQACVAQSAAREVRLPIGPFSANLRRQFCEAVPDIKGKEPAPPGATAPFFCGPVLRFEGNSNLPMDGMTLQVHEIGAFILWALGCVVTGFFVALGAPFWFGVLGKVVDLRASGRKSEAEEENRRGRGAAPVAPPTGPTSSAGPGASGAPQSSKPAPFSLARNGFEDQLVAADIVSVQRQLGVTATGVLDAPTRTAIAAYTREHGLEATDELSFTVYDSITGRAPTGVAVTRPSNRPALGEVNESAQPLARNLMAQLGFPGRIPAAETRFTPDLRALAVLYRYKREAPTAPHARSTVDLARSNRAALDELDPKLASEILSFTGVVLPALARDASAPWLDWAIGELGQKEAGKNSRAESNPRVLQYLDTEPGRNGGDNTPWCGGFAAWVLAQHNANLPAGVLAGVSAPPPNALASAQWCSAARPAWGHSVGAGPGVIGGAQAGDVVTLKLGGSAVINHVAFVLEVDPANNALWVIGGNQAKGTCVCVSRFKAAEIEDIRRP